MNRKIITLCICSLILLYIYILNKTKNKKLNIIFDMDETLLTYKDNEYFKYYNKNSYKTSDYELKDGYVVIRPFVKNLLPIMAKYNNLYLFTKGSKSYANEILGTCNMKSLFNKIITRENNSIYCPNKLCNMSHGFYIDILNMNMKPICKYCGAELKIDKKLNKICEINPKSNITENYYYICKDIELIGGTSSNTLLVDDLLINSCNKQKIYHIKKFNFYPYMDYEILKLSFYVLWLNIKYDLIGKI